MPGWAIKNARYPSGSCAAIAYAVHTARTEPTMDVAQASPPRLGENSVAMVMNTSGTMKKKTPSANPQVNPMTADPSGEIRRRRMSRSVIGPGAVHRARSPAHDTARPRSGEHTSELQSLAYIVCRLLLLKKKKNKH